MGELKVEQEKKTAERREKVLQMTLAGAKQVDIVKATGFSQTQVTRDIKKLKPILEQRMGAHIDKVLARHQKLFMLRTRFYESVLRLPDTDGERSNFYQKLRAAQASAKEEIEILGTLIKFLGKRETESSENVWGAMLEHVKRIEEQIRDEAARTGVEIGVSEEDEQ